MKPVQIIGDGAEAIIWRGKYYELPLRPPEKQYTEGHCQQHKQPGGCQLHNLQCGWPECDRREVVQ